MFFFMFFSEILLENMIKFHRISLQALAGVTSLTSQAAAAAGDPVAKFCMQHAVDYSVGI